MLKNSFVKILNRGKTVKGTCKIKNKVGLYNEFDGDFDFSNFPLPPHDAVNKELKLYNNSKVKDLAQSIYERKACYGSDKEVLANIEYILYRMDMYGIDVNLIPHCFNEKGHYVLPLMMTEDLSYEDWIKLNENSIPNLKELLIFLDSRNTTKGFKDNLYISAYLENREDAYYESLDDLLLLCSENISLWVYDAPACIKEEFRIRTDNLIGEHEFLQRLLTAITYVTLDGAGNLSKADWIKIRDTLLKG